MKNENTEDLNPIEKHVYLHYTDRKQAQDDGWWLYYSNVLSKKGVKSPNSFAMNIAKEFLNGSTFESAFLKENLPLESKKGILKMARIALRKEWVKQAISEGLQAIEEDREANYPTFPNFKE